MLMRQEVWWWVIRVFYLCFFLFIINRIFFVSSGMVEQAVSCVTYPFLKIHTNIAQTMESQAERKKTVQELQTLVGSLGIEQEFLKQRIAQLEAQQIVLEHTTEIREFADRYQDQHSSMAKVLMCYSCPQEDAMFIEGGHNRHYGKDDIVVYKNALIGRIIEVYPWYSKVAVITDQRCRISATVGLDAQGICCGKNSGNVEHCFVPHYKNVSVGEHVMSTGQGLLYPSGFIIGTVESVQTDLVAHTILVKPYYQLSDIPYVYVFLKNIEIPKSEVALIASQQQTEQEE